ncbi:MAG TPA: ImmA/IrrE family metallo-endopeptidase [Actinomycetota bacterium]|nr:ImmA/IrrE family metallo-endopeptidase [Actinomycetota bacterium]
MKDLAKTARGILRNAALKEPPTDLARILAYLRIHHERPWHMSQDVWEGLGRPTRGRTRFKSQEQASTPRQRWKLAHEIAHHVLHGAEPHLRAGSWETHELEYEADLLAAELLIPAPWLQRAVKKAVADHTMLDIEDLARTFKVGRQEMEKRLKQLDLLRGEVPGRM